MRERLLSLWDRFQKNANEPPYCHIHTEKLHVTLFLETGEPNWLTLVFTDKKNKMDANDLVYVRDWKKEKINDLWEYLHFSKHLNPAIPFLSFVGEKDALELTFFQPMNADNHIVITIAIKNDFELRPTIR
jgi:hypothetical protein